MNASRLQQFARHSTSALVLGASISGTVAGQSLSVYKSAPQMECEDCPPLQGVAFDGITGWPSLPPCAGALDARCYFTSSTHSYPAAMMAMFEQYGGGGGSGSQDLGCQFICWDPETGARTSTVYRIDGGMSCNHSNGNPNCVFISQTPWIDNNNDGHHYLDSEDGSTPGNPPEDDTPYGPDHPFNDNDGDNWPNAVDPKPNDHQNHPERGHPSPVLPKSIVGTGNGQLKAAILKSELGIELDPQDLDSLDIQDVNNDGHVSFAEVAPEVASWSEQLADDVRNDLAIGGLARELALDRVESVQRAFNAAAVAIRYVYGEESLATRQMTQKARLFDQAVYQLSTTVQVAGATVGEEVVDTTQISGSGAEVTRHPDGFAPITTTFSGPGGVALTFSFMVFQQALQGQANQTSVADPVDTARGEFLHVETDLQIPGRGMDLVIRRHYRSRDARHGVAGPNWSVPMLETQILVWARYGSQRVLELSWGDGNRSVFRQIATGDPNELLWEGVGGEFGKIRMGAISTCNPGAGPEAWLSGMGMVLRMPDATEYWFCPPTIHPGAPGCGISYLNRIVDRNGNVIRLRRDADGRVYQIVDTLGRSLFLEYDGPLRRLARIFDWSGRKVEYSYDNLTGDLIRVDLPTTQFLNGQGIVSEGRPYTAYEYDQHPSGYVINSDVTLNHNLTKITNALGETVVGIQYFSVGDYELDRVSAVVVAGRTTTFQYTPITAGNDSNPKVSHVTTVIFPDGQKERFFHGNGLLLRHEVYNGEFTAAGALIPGSQDPNGPGAWNTKFEYNEDYLLVEERKATDVDPTKARVRTRRYDDSNADRFQHGNLLEEREFPSEPVSGQESLARSFEYDPITASPITQIDSLGRTTRYFYGHQELPYAQVASELGLADWGVANLSPILWGLGDLNGDGILGIAMQPVRVESPTVSLASDNGPNDSVLNGYVPTKLVQFGPRGSVAAARDEKGTWTTCGV